MRHLIGKIRPYAWGSRTAIPALLGRPPSGGPQAELWLGAHPDDPSLLETALGVRRSLLGEIEADPIGLLGADVEQRHGPRLPFLLKVLAAEEPLSLQVHPSAAQARVGFDAEEAAGVPRDAAQRNYVDPCHKPELLVAVTEFEGLCGFRDVAVSARLLERLLDGPAAAALTPATASVVASVAASLRRWDPRRGLRESCATLLTLSERQQEELVGQVAAACRRLTDGGHAVAYATAAGLAGRYPGDIAAVCSLLLNHVRLAPGEAIYMPAGNLHAYLRGVGVEVMAASDNVLRAGLTPKHVDVPELLKVLRYEELSEPRIAATAVEPGVVRWPAPVSDFRLTHARVDGVTRLPEPSPSPRIVLCLRGRVRTDDGQGEITLGSGQAGLASAGSEPVTLRGVGEVFQASVGVAGGSEEPARDAP